MTVTIEGGAARLVTGGFGITGLGGEVTLTPRHPSGTAVSYALTKSAVSVDDPIKLTLTGAIPAATTVLASSALRPDGCYYEVTWRIFTRTGGEEKITYDIWLGPDGGTCDITDPAHRVQAADAPALIGWPDTGPVPVYASEGTP